MQSLSVKCTAAQNGRNCPFTYWYTAVDFGKFNISQCKLCFIKHISHQPSFKQGKFDGESVNCDKSYYFIITVLCFWFKQANIGFSLSS